MAHELATMLDGRTAMAYVGDAPWHSLGQPLSPGASKDVWRVEAGHNYDVLKAPVQFNSEDGESIHFRDQYVLYRSDNKFPLSVVGKNYKIVQPSDILDFFFELSNIGGFELETAGVLSGGKRIWGLARVNDGAPIIGHDIVRPYVLFATSYDGTMATTAKFTGIRVVCNNTITLAVGNGDTNKSESDIENRAVNTMIRINHTNNVNFKEVRNSLGIVDGVFERWLVNTRLLAERDLTQDEFAKFTYQLIDSITPAPAPGRNVVKIEETKSYKRIMDIFATDMIGGDLTGGNNAWKALNAVTQFVDYERGRTPDSRMTGAWFGVGEGMKSRAYNKLMELATA